MHNYSKTLLKLSIPRIKLLRNRREIQLKQMRRDIAKLLETGQEATARSRVCFFALCCIVPVKFDVALGICGLLWFL